MSDPKPPAPARRGKSAGEPSSTPIENANVRRSGAWRPAAAASRIWAAGESARPPPRGPIAAPRPPPVSRGPGRPIAGRLTRGFGELVERSERAADIAAPAFGLDLRDQSLRILADGLVQIAHPHKIVDMGEEPICHAARLRLRRRGQHVRRRRAERCRQRAVGRRPICHRLQRRQRGGVDAEMLQGCELGSKRRAGAEPVFRSLGNDGDRGGVLGGSALLRSRARFALGRGERGLDLVDPRGEGGKIRAGSRSWLAARSRASRLARTAQESRRARRRRRLLRP